MFDFSSFVFLIGYLRQVVVKQLAASQELPKWKKHHGGRKQQLKARMVKALKRCENGVCGIVHLGSEEIDIGDEYIDFEIDHSATIEFRYYASLDKPTYDVNFAEQSARDTMYNCMHTTYHFNVVDGKVSNFFRRVSSDTDDGQYCVTVHDCKHSDVYCGIRQPCWHLRVSKLVIATPSSFQVFDVYLDNNYMTYDVVEC